MKVERAARPGSCDVVEAMFVFGPTRCWQQTEFVTEDDGEMFYICEEHIVAAGVEVPA